MQRKISPGFRKRFDDASGGGDSFSFGNALIFDGLNDRITLDNIWNWENISTVSIWFKKTDFTRRMLITGIATSDYIDISNATTIRLVVNGASTTLIVPTMTANIWYHLMVTRNGADAKVYLNGVESTTGTVTISTISTAIKGFASFRGTGFYFNGSLDEILLKNGTVGTLADSVLLYRGGLGTLSSDVITSPDHFYRFNESSGTNLPDTGNATTNNGLLEQFADPASSWVAH